MKNKLPRFFYITGCDGTGKTTQARFLVGHLRQHGNRVCHVWLRYPFFFSSPLLLYARLRRMSWFEVHAGHRYGYWDFENSRIMRTILPWVLLVDAFLAACWRIYLPMATGNIVVCERFVLDMVVDLSLAYKDKEFLNTLAGRQFPRLIPRTGKTVILDLDPDVIRERRSHLVWDRLLDQRRSYYCFLAENKNIPVIENRLPVETVAHQIASLFGCANDAQ